jgi:short-subunit dehydrogenase
VKDLDICIIVNNAGVINYGYFRDYSLSLLREGVLVNTYPYVLLTKVLLDKMLLRSTQFKK